MKRYSIFLVILSFLFLCACGGGGGGDGDKGSSEENLAPIADAGVDQSVIENDIVTLDGSNSSDPEGNPLTFSWVQKDGTKVTLYNDTTEQPNFTAPEVEESATLTFELTVSDGKKSAVADCTVTVLKRAVLDTREQAEDVLFAAYAGIGYMDAGISGDEEDLYRVMLDDLSAVTGNFIYDTIFSYMEGLKLLELLQLASGNVKTLNYTDANGNECSLYIKPGSLDWATGRRPFYATFSVDFSSTGYSVSNCNYTGQDETIDLSGIFSGYFKAKDEYPYLEEFFIKSIDLVAQDSLVATYNTFVVVHYNGWELSCDIYYGVDDPEYDPARTHPVNVVFDPISWSGSDYDRSFRDYTVGGSFSVDGNTYTYANGFNYQQKEYSFIIDDDPVTLTMIFIEGDLMVPGTDGFIDVDTPDDYWNDPIGSGTIIRNDDGIWTSGMMTLIAGNEVHVDFDNGIADFTGDLREWSVAGWQDELEPF